MVIILYFDGPIVQQEPSIETCLSTRLPRTKVSVNFASVKLVMVSRCTNGYSSVRSAHGTSFEELASRFSAMWFQVRVWHMDRLMSFDSITSRGLQGAGSRSSPKGLRTRGKTCCLAYMSWREHILRRWVSFSLYMYISMNGERYCG